MDGQQAWEKGRLGEEERAAVWGGKVHERTSERHKMPTESGPNAGEEGQGCTPGVREGWGGELGQTSARRRRLGRSRSTERAGKSQRRNKKCSYMHHWADRTRHHPLSCRGERQGGSRDRTRKYEAIKRLKRVHYTHQS